MDIIERFYDHRNEEQAGPMAKYMKNKFPFLGLKKQERVTLSKDFFKIKRIESSIDWDFIFDTYDLPEREFQYLAIDYMNLMKDLLIPDDMDKIERLLVTKSWWDSVDSINISVGHLAMKYPEIKQSILSQWMTSENIWLKRITIIFQLKYKEKTDTDFLSRSILTNASTGEFFVNKAIGWALREFSKTNKQWVREFIDRHHQVLSKLSIREGSKYI